MNEKIGLEDGSEDKRYFTMLPNYIANHSTAVAQALYFQLKRLAGEGNDGLAYPGYRHLMEKLGISRNTLRKEIQYLLNKEWIKYVGKRELQTDSGKQKVKAYKIVNIWKLNIDYYDSISRGVKIDAPKVGQNVTSRGVKIDAKEEPLEEDTIQASPVLTLISFFAKEYEDYLPNPPMISYGQAGALVKRFLKSHTPEEGEDLVETFIQSKYAESKSHGIGTCFSAATIELWRAGNLK